ncbi:hypothetical protein ACFFX0_30045 [Citricoccus parietis]|uniref:Uncharacterized protein n=1 Tax=Citricoccus parietis TaxID=592307 RepID=A0ABV5G8C7_9MICC
MTRRRSIPDARDERRLSPIMREPVRHHAKRIGRAEDGDTDIWPVG